MTEPQDRIICSTVFTSPSSVVPSTQSTCGDCGDLVWVSEVMTPRVTSGELLPVCEMCALLITGKPTFAIAPEQVHELEGLGLREFAEGFAAKMNKKEEEGDG